MTSPDAVLKHLRAHDIQVDPNTLESLLNDDTHGAGFKEWVSTYITPDTFLSTDELALYAALEKSGQVETLAASLDPSTVFPISDDEMKRAIEELNRSTDAIAKQTETLKLQQDAVSRLVNEQSNRTARRRDLELKQQQDRQSSQQKLLSAVEELSQMLSLRLTELEQHDKATGKDIEHTVERLLHSDDKLLASLQKLGWELQTEDPEEQENVGKLREVCAQLIKYRVEAIRTKLDRIYLETLIRSHQSDGGRADRDEISALQEEVESLYAEILPVAQMSVEQQYLEPSLKSLSSRNGQTLERSLTAVNYVGECLDFLVEHINLLSGRIEVFKAHQVAASKIVTMTEHELSIPAIVPVVAKESQQPADVSPVRRRKSSGRNLSVSPVRNRGLAHSRKRSSGAFNSDIPPMEQILQILAILLTHHDKSNLSEAERKAQVEALATSLAERTAKAEDVARNVQEAFEDTTSTYLADISGAVAKIRETLLAESTYGDVNLADPGIDGSIEVLAQEVEKVNARLEGAEKEMAKAKGPSAKREELIARWAR